VHSLELFLCIEYMNLSSSVNKRGTRKNRLNMIHRLPTDFSQRIYKYSDPKQAQKMAHRYLGKTAKLYPSTNRHKKYDIYDPIHGHWVHFGQMGYEDYTKHKDRSRRKNYLTRSAKIRGNWKRNPYSANNLSRRILW